jgi:serine/threonine protein kinase
MSLRRGVELALDAARGLAYMHNRKPAPIVHRDLKPANLMISGALTQVHSGCVPCIC